MKKIFTISVVVILALLAFFLFAPDKATDEYTDQDLVGDVLYVTSFTRTGKNGTGTMLLQVPFQDTLSNPGLLSIAVDVNGDNLFAPDEYLVEGYPVSPRKGWKSGYYASRKVALTDGLTVQVTVNDTQYLLATKMNLFEVGTLLDIGNITDPENAMKGFDTATAHAEDTNEITQENVPDISQKPGECAPTSATNGILSLIGKNGKPGDVPGTPEEIMEDLKKEMKWNRENGVEPDNFVAGKNSWAQKHGLPIVTEKVGDVHGISTIEEIRKALESNGAVELRIKFANPGGTQAVGGHMVTVTGIHEGDGQTYLDINDPATPEGTETVEIQSNQITNYGPWEGVTILSWAFVQNWKLDKALETSLGTSVDEKPLAVEMAYDHVKPGEYSEVYAVVMTEPGEEVSAKLEGPAVERTGFQSVIADKNGQAYFTWKIFQYGTYVVSGANGSNAGFTGNITVK